jgi:transposase InsO family protein
MPKRSERSAVHNGAQRGATTSGDVRDIEDTENESGDPEISFRPRYELDEEPDCSYSQASSAAEGKKQRSPLVSYVTDGVRKMYGVVTGAVFPKTPQASSSIPTKKNTGKPSDPNVNPSQHVAVENSNDEVFEDDTDEYVSDDGEMHEQPSDHQAVVTQSSNMKQSSVVLSADDMTTKRLVTTKAEVHRNRSTLRYSNEDVSAEPGKINKVFQKQRTAAVTKQGEQQSTYHDVETDSSVERPDDRQPHRARYSPTFRPKAARTVNGRYLKDDDSHQLTARYDESPARSPMKYHRYRACADDHCKRSYYDSKKKKQQYSRDSSSDAPPRHDEHRSIKASQEARTEDSTRRRHDSVSRRDLSSDGATYRNHSRDRLPKVAAMKPGKYDGTKSLDTFLAQFETCASYNQWNCDDKCAFLKCALTDGPAQLLWDSGDPSAINYNQLVERLRARYGSTGQAEKFRAELRSRRRRRGESLSELHSDIRRLMALAYPGLGQSDVCEVIARDHFIDALGDGNFELKIREREPADLDTALRLAVRLEAYANARTSQPEVENQYRRADERLTKRVAQVENSLRRLNNESRTADTDDWRRRYEQLSKDYERLKFLEEQRNVNQYTVDQQRQMKEPPLAATNRRDPPTCYGCGATGHYKRSCPRNETLAPRTQMQDTTKVQQAEKTSNAIRHNATSVPTDYDSEAYIRMRISGEPVDCLLDTGSEVTLVSSRLVKSAVIVPSNQTLRAANGTLIPVEGRVTLRGAVGRLILPIEGLVTKHIDNVILGLSWLRQQKAVWNFEKGTVQLNGKSFKLYSRKPQGYCRRIIIDEAAVVPPLTESELSTIVMYDHISGRRLGADQAWMTEIAEPVTGLLVSRTLVPSRPVDVPVRVMNITKDPIKLPSGTVLTTLQPVQPIEKSDETQTRVTAEQEEILRSLVGQVDTGIPAETKEQLLKILSEYRDAFSFNENDIGRTNIIRHSIDTGDAKPVRQPLRRQPPAHQAAIKEHVATMLTQGIIEPAQSPWASNVVIVMKKDGTTRCCVDYRQVNNLTRKDAYPLPRTDDCLDALAGARWFTTLDLRSSYHQIEMEYSDADKTAFICREGSFRYRTMPFGLSNAGATFQRLMDILMVGLKFESIIVYLDDILIYSYDLNQHLERLREVLQRLRKAGLKLKPNKCKFMRRSVDFLGHVVSADGIRADPGKISAVLDWPVPNNLTELRAYLGLCSYYRRFVQNFSEIAAPLYGLTAKKCPFVWNDDCQQAFQDLKSKLTTAPVLCMANDQDVFCLDTDASDFAIGAVLSQNVGGTERVVAYASKRLSRCERNYCVTRRELLAVVYFTKYFRNYLLGRRFSIRTDHAALQWLRRMSDPCGQQARWIGALEQFDYEILHRPGTRHGNADAMSRRPCDKKRCCPKSDAINEMDESNGESQPRCAAVNNDTTAESANTDEVSSLPALEMIQQSQLEDGDISPIYNLIVSGNEQPTWDDVAHMSNDSKALWRQWQRLCVTGGILYRRFERVDTADSFWQVILPRTLRQEFVITAHEGATGGHLGRKRTEATVRARAYWPGWMNDVKKILRRCTPCARYHRGTAPRQTVLKPFYSGEPWETVSLDITGPHPRSRRGYVYLLTVMDHFSKWTEALPVRNHTAPTIARMLYDHVFSRFGMPLRLLTDQGPEFESQLFKNLCQLLRVAKIRTSPYKPSTNGMLERFHRTLNSMIAKIVDENQRNWCELVPAVMAAYRATPHDTTGYSPNKLMFGRENRMPIDLMFPAPPTSNFAGPDDYVEAVEERLRIAYETVRKNIGTAASYRKDRYDAGIKGCEIKEGDLVWYFHPRRKTGLSPKWQSWYTGPYCVMKVIDSHCISIQKTRRSRPLVVHRDKLKPFNGDVPKEWQSQAQNGVYETQRKERPAQHASKRNLSPELRDTQAPRRSRRKPGRFNDYVC